MRPVSELKRCPRCERTLVRAEAFYFRSNGAKGMRWESYCKECCCRNVPPEQYEKMKARHRDWYHANRETELAKNRARQPEIYKRRLAAGYHIKSSQLQRDRLKDTYIKHLLAYPGSGIDREQVTPELIDLKRQQMILRKLSRELKQATTKESK